MIRVYSKLPGSIRFSLRVSLLYFLLWGMMHMPFLFDQGIDPTHPGSLLVAGLFMAYRLFFIIAVPFSLTSWAWDRMTRKTTSLKGR